MKWITQYMLGQTKGIFKDGTLTAFIGQIKKAETDEFLKNMLRSLLADCFESNSVYYMRRFINLETLQFKYDDPTLWEFSLCPYEAGYEIKKNPELEMKFEMVEKRMLK